MTGGYDEPVSGFTDTDGNFHPLTPKDYAIERLMRACSGMRMHNRLEVVFALHQLGILDDGASLEMARDILSQ